MFDSIRSHRRWLMFFLLLLVFPSFVVTGIYGYTRFVGGENDLARVAGQPVSSQEFDQAQRQRAEQLRQMLGANFDPGVLETPEARSATLDTLIAQRVLQAEAAAEHMSVSADRLREVIAGIPAFQRDGRFDLELYRQVLRSQGRSELSFEREIQTELAQQTLLQAVSASALVPRSVTARLLQTTTEVREVREMRFPAADYASKVSVTDDMIKAYYESNRAQFQIAETAKVEFAVLSLDSVAGRIEAPEADLRAYYEQNKGRFGSEEQRRASHILLTGSDSGGAVDKAAARKLGGELLDKLKADPRAFAALARQHSRDPGSAAQGGDLGFFGRGMMVKPFEDAVYALKPGELSGLVETDFGVHIIQLNEVRPAQAKPFESVRAQIEQEYRRSKAQTAFAEAAESFTNTVYEQADSLQPAADKLKLKVETIEALPRNGLPPRAPGADIFTRNVLKAVFSDESLRGKRNTQAIDIGNNTLVAARVIEHRPASTRPIEEVREGIRVQVQLRESLRLAREAAEARKAALAQAPTDAGLGPVRSVSRSQPAGLPAATLRAVLQVPGDKLPAYVVGDLDATTVGLLRVVSAKMPDDPNGAQAQQLAGLVGQQVGNADDNAFVYSLRQRHGVDILKPDYVRMAPAKGAEKSADKSAEKK